MRPVLKETRRRARGALIWVGLFSLAANLLLLAPPLYMLQVYDRVLSSRSVETLIYLTVIVLFALLIFVTLDFLRGRILSAVGVWMDRQLSGPILNSCISDSLAARRPSANAVRDVATVRDVLSGPSVLPLFDAPWTPVFLAVIFLLHPMLGWVAIWGAAALIVLSIVNEFATRRTLDDAGLASARAQLVADQAVRNADAVRAMGLGPNLTNRLLTAGADAVDLQNRAGWRGASITALSKFLRQGLQVGMLGLGAWFVLLGQLTPGAMIAGSILLARALAPVDMLIGSWRNIVTGRRALRRIAERLDGESAAPPPMPLPEPLGALSVDGVGFAHAGAEAPALAGVTFALRPGESLGVVGPSAAGKTTLARVLVGTLKPQAGHARLDGADLAVWNADDRGRHIGYLPQDTQLFTGNVRDNIARFDDADPDQIVDAAVAAGAHQMILGLPDGYESQIGEAGAALSGGQRQLIALARALYGDPALVVLDEPGTALDRMGDEAVHGALRALKERGATVVVISHRPGLMRFVDKMLVLDAGRVRHFGCSEEVLAKVTATPQLDVVRP